MATSTKRQSKPDRRQRNPPTFMPEAGDDVDRGASTVTGQGEGDAFFCSLVAAISSCALIRSPRGGQVADARENSSVASTAPQVRHHCRHSGSRLSRRSSGPGSSITSVAGGYQHAPHGARESTRLERRRGQ